MTDEIASHYTNRGTYSPTWNYFKRLSPGIAKCNICKRRLSYRTSISNLKRHLHLKHQLSLDNFKHKVPQSFNIGNEEVNVKTLIGVVKRRPCLWDKTSSYYKNLEKQTDAWKEIASLLCPEVDTTIAAENLSERFSSLYEHFGQNLLLLASSANIRPSAYDNNLKLLQEEPVRMDIFEIHEVHVKNEPLDESYNGNDVDPIQENSSLQDFEVGHVKKNEPDAFEEHNFMKSDGDHVDGAEFGSSGTTGNLGTPKESRTPKSKSTDGKRMPTEYSLQMYNADKDVLFLLSLSEEMKRVPQEQKTNFKGDLMTAISRLVQKYNNRLSGNGCLEKDA